MTYRFKAPARPVNRVFIHCSASDIPAHDNIATIRAWHTKPKPHGQGWQDVGYHFFIRKDGTLELGRSLELIPAAQAMANTKTIAICLSGLNNFTPRQFETLNDLCHQIHTQLPLATFHGHREVAPWKTCPNFAYREVLGLDAKGNLT